MRRAEDELTAISPPPEFQDTPIPSTSSLVVALPPPLDFRDLTPSSPGFGDTGILTFGFNPHTILPIQSHHHGRTFVRRVVWDFAERISFSIVNEAMVIATILPEAGAATVRDFRVASLNPGPRLGSSERNVLSTTTSWEYLSPNPSQLNHAKPKHSKEDLAYSKNNSNNLNPNPNTLRIEMDLHTRFRTDLDPDHVPAVILESNKIPPPTIQDIVSQALPNKNARRKSLDSSKQSAIINSLFEPSDRGGPIECDIYSLPVDNLPPGSSDPTTAIIDEIIRHRFKKYDNSNKPLRHSIHLGERLEARIAEEQSTGRCLKVKNSQRQQRNFLVLEASSEEDKPSVCVEEIVIRLEPNNNYEAERNSTEVLRKGGPSQRHKKRRGENGESQNAKDKIENTHPSEPTVGSLGQKEKSSQHINNEDSVKEDAHGSPGKEKRNFGHTFFNLFRRNRIKDKSLHSSNHNEIECSILEGTSKINRALPSPPFILEEAETEATDHDEQPPSRHSHIEPLDVGASLVKVKDCGWYWGPLSSEGAQDLLRGEPDGSFMVRDSSDARYIFSLTFKLNGLIRHVRIEHDQGNFSFGPRTRFKAATIVDFVEKAVAHSRSGRYLFFLHRRPVLGPMQVQLLHPYSRFMHHRSLQHMCRFVILKTVRRDLINHLSLPKPILEYLNAPQYYFEQLEH